MTGSTLHIGYLKQPISEKIQCRDIMDEAKSTYGYIKSAQDRSDNKSHSRDSFEKAVETIESMYGCYSDIGTVKGKKNGTFDYHFIWDMQKDISDHMKDFYAGKASEKDLEKYFGIYCSYMRIYRMQQYQTSEKSEDDNKQIISDIYDIFAKENMRAARNANYFEGEKVNLSYGRGGDDWVYYNADYYYKCEETREKLRKIAENMASKWEVSSFDAQEAERNSKYTLDGGLDFNSGWNFCFRNQTGRSSLAKESVVPPEGFKMFFKENAYPKEKGKGIDSIGTLEISAGKNKYKREVIFRKLRTGLEGEIFDAGILMKDYLLKEDGYVELLKFLSEFSVFTRGYSSKSGIMDRFGDYTPIELKK